MSVEEDLFALLNAGKINDAMQIACNTFLFNLEETNAIIFLSRVLDELGFNDESESINKYLNEYIAFRKNTAKEWNENIALGKASDNHSHGYKRDVKNLLTHPYWDKRAQKISKLIPKGTKLLDLGCGEMLIENYLDSPQEYIPCDIHPRDNRTIICDFDKQEYPDFNLLPSCVICLGVLNYLNNQKPLMERICSYNAQSVIITFKPMEFIQKKVTLGHFPPALKLSEVKEIMQSNGYKVGSKFLLGQGDEILFHGIKKK
ncbi:hypothetical protein [Motiliproteus sp. MSK22-1]|uniref:hypothetical protein n=1 Tax=Motiliproteus sp. MSK22-1 TaxID=1897630 RepID=UPI0009763206|nr:hypothetical protein [Motiliproteus sp. MSK22-1]OMH30321.1 hypothetical protein BGP75_18215 [Motiliproteus sp. MSK22-1]